jgi:hypothetical protein
VTKEHGVDAENPAETHGKALLQLKKEVFKVDLQKL